MEAYGFDYVAVDAQGVGVDDVFVFAGGGHDNYGDKAGVLVGFELAEDFDAANFGHVEVEEDYFGFIVDGAGGVVAFGEEEVECFGPIGKVYEVVAEVVAFECADGEFGIGRVVFDKEDFNGVHRMCV